MHCDVPCSAVHRKTEVQLRVFFSGQDGLYRSIGDQLHMGFVKSRCTALTFQAIWVSSFISYCPFGDLILLYIAMFRKT